MRKPKFSFIGGLQAQIKIELCRYIQYITKIMVGNCKLAMPLPCFIYGGAKCTGMKVLHSITEEEVMYIFMLMKEMGVYP